MVSELESELQAANYDHWFRVQVQAGQAMARVDAQLNKRRIARATQCDG